MGMWHVWEKTEIHIAFWGENLKDIDHFKKLSVDGGILPLKCFYTYLA
jgi:hypothetical protein